MDRRHFLSLTAGAAAAVALPLSAQAETLTYKPGLIKKHLNAGNTVVVSFNTNWCSTCAAQKRGVKALKASNPAYEAGIVFIEVDFDKYGRSSPVAKSLRVRNRSTMVALRGGKELGRVEWGTGRPVLKALLDSALSAGA